MDQNKNLLKKTLLNITRFVQSESLLVYLLAFILLTIPLNFAFGSIACITFLFVAFLSSKKVKFDFNLTLVFPISFYLLMIISVYWSIKPEMSVHALQKELLFLIMPIAFLLMPKLNKILIEKVLQIYSFGMVFYAVFYFVKAFLRYKTTLNPAVFYFHELVTLDLNAIFIASMASVALFYFVQAKKHLVNQLAIMVLLIFTFFLSSKSVIFIDIILIIWYYTYFSKTVLGVKTVTIVSFFAFFVLSFVFVPQIKNRFFTEYETAFVDNTVNKDFGDNNNKVFNVSLSQAWNKNEFKPNDFFPGTAIRIFQIRIFKEMMIEEKNFLTGFGLDATQEKIKEKTKKYKLYPFYGELNFHNQYIQTFSELGLFGFIILVIMLSLNLKNAVVAKDFLHIVFAFSMIVLFLTESFFCRQRGIVFFITLYCIFNSVNAAKLKTKPA